MLTHRLIVAGHSHTLALIEGAERDAASGSFASLDAGFEVSFLAKWREAMVGAQWSESGFKRLEESRSLVDFVVGSGATHVALMWLGNQMSVRALLLNGPPFDVLLPNEDRHDVDPSLQLIPYSVVRSSVAARLEKDPALVSVLDTLRGREIRVCLLGPPPPLPEPAARERLAQSPHFAAVMEELNLNPTDARIVADPVRNRLRSVMLETYASFAASHGADFVPPPEEATDQAGMLAAPYWTDDVTHGNSAYGTLYMREVLEWLGSRSDAEHPYRAAPNRSFWSRSVARDFAVESVPDPPGFELTAQDRFMSAGSCFAANIARYLRGWGYHYVVTEYTHPQWPEGAELGFYDAYSARYGNIYTARQMVQLLERVTGSFHPDEECWTAPEGQLIDPFRPGLSHRASSILEYRALTAQHLRAVRSAIEDSSVLIFTLGLTEAWISRSDGAVFPACPGTVADEFDPDRHGFVNFSVQDVVSDLHQMIGLLRSIQPNLKIILTVSPVPLVATGTTHHVLAATVYSKSVLRVAAEQTADTHQNVSYFPAYELVTGPHHHDSPFEPDLRTVREPIIAAVMDSFHSTFFQDRVESQPDYVDVCKPDFTNMISEAISAECEEMLADEQLRTSDDLPSPPTGAMPA